MFHLTTHKALLATHKRICHRYPAAQQQLYPLDREGRKTIVMGGTCDSVGVGGCWLGGCYGPFTKKFGNGAVNMLQAKVVLPNGTLITTSEVRR
jgi:FAD/FMN-containing dehydrogenase